MVAITATAHIVELGETAHHDAMSIAEAKETGVFAEPPRAPERTSGKSEFGFLRLLFASLVILSHVPGQIYGDRSHEPLSHISSITFGDLAVDGFFIVSGYLVTLSFEKSSSIASYFFKRIIRIYPAYLVAFLICMFVVAPLGGGATGQLSIAHWPSIIWQIIRLRLPELPPAFGHLPINIINAPMWTIAFEFRCYILVAIWGGLGLFRQRWIFAALTAVTLAAHVVYSSGVAYPIQTIPGIGETFRLFRLVGLFMTGTCFYLFRDKIPLNRWGALLAAVQVFIGLRFAPITELAIAVAGGYLIFWSSQNAPSAIRRLNTKNDISYGYYLYAWPIGQLIVYWFGKPMLFPTIAADFGLAALAGTLSWFAIEKPFTKIKPGRRPRPLTDGN